MAGKNRSKGHQILQLAELAKEGMRHANTGYMLWAKVEKIAKRGEVDVDGRAVKTKEPPDPVVTLSVTDNADGSFQVLLGAVRTGALSPLLAILIQILALDDGTSQDQFVSWKPIDWVIAEMRAIPGRENFNEHALSQAVYRLREILGHDLVQTHRVNRAYRLVLLRKDSARALRS